MSIFSSRNADPSTSSNAGVEPAPHRLTVWAVRRLRDHFSGALPSALAPYRHWCLFPTPPFPVPRPEREVAVSLRGPCCAHTRHEAPKPRDSPQISGISGPRVSGISGRGRAPHNPLASPSFSVPSGAYASYLLSAHSPHQQRDWPAGLTLSYHKH